jgi:asparagine synthase (glutamine-hydrolysing)
MSGVDAARDRDEAARLEQSGATAIVSGQGGDAIFFQMPSALVLTDEMRRSGWRALSTALPADLARRTQGSVWRVLRDARAAARGRSPPPHRSSLISGELRAATAGVAHAWVEAARDAGVAPGKRLQIEAISNCHVYHGQSRRRRQGELLYPLLAQPVVELCLAIATADLAGGAHDRLYARAVFSERIPEAVRRRRTKGAFNVEFGRLVARSAEVLRPFLVDGCLAEAGLLDREAVRRALDPAVTIQGGQPTEVMWAACVEAWVRYWQTRLPDSRAAPRWPAQR